MTHWNKIYCIFFSIKFCINKYLVFSFDGIIIIKFQVAFHPTNSLMSLQKVNKEPQETFRNPKQFKTFFNKFLSGSLGIFTLVVLFLFYVLSIRTYRRSYFFCTKIKFHLKVITRIGKRFWLSCWRKGLYILFEDFLFSYSNCIWTPVYNYF